VKELFQCKKVGDVPLKNKQKSVLIYEVLE
jgi:hypothetical protein